MTELAILELLQDFANDVRRIADAAERIADAAELEAHRDEEPAE